MYTNKKKKKKKRFHQSSDCNQAIVAKRFPLDPLYIMQRVRPETIWLWWFMIDLLFLTLNNRHNAVPPCWNKHEYKNVTGSAKTSLIAHDRKFNFFVTNTDTSIHYQVSLPKWRSLGWSASAGCFFPAHWRFVRAVWVHHGALVGR